MCQARVCGGQVTREGPWEAVQSLLQSRPRGARMLLSLTGRGVCGVVFPVTLACPPAHSWPEKALGRYRQGEGKAVGATGCARLGHSQ